jgi:YidC/Oxa1 family membrane protein insertase
MNEDTYRLLLAIILSVGVLFGWHYFFEKPKIHEGVEKKEEYSKTMKEYKSKSESKFEGFQARDLYIANSSDARIKISTPKIKGSIALKGMRFDDVTLLDYKKDLKSNKEGLALLAPSNTEESYFAEVGWYSEFAGTDLPNKSTVWKADARVLEIGNPVNFSWVNQDNVEFIIKVTIDDHYMFLVEQKVINHSRKAISLAPYGLINKLHTQKQASNFILHEGPIGVFSDTLEELSYEKTKDKKLEKFASGKVGWLGITDKYWITTFIPDRRYEYDAKYSYGMRGGIDQYQVDYLGKQKVLEQGSILEHNNMFFTGPKKVDLLDDYSSKYDINLFDRVIDFGIFYIITKPLFHILNFFYKYFGNFGISIIFVTVIVKLLMFGVANKSFRSMKKMKMLQPEIERLKKLYAEDKTKLNQEIMMLYKKEKVNPVSGCLPLFIQIPVFFSIYKVLYVTIEMRHAPFYGWIKDLSAPDPTSIFNLFGMLQFSPPEFLMIGIWPIFMAMTMFLQQRMSPSPTDPVQAMMMKFLPVMFLVMFSRFPAGLLIYWTWNNILSIVQQYSINKLDKSS